MSTAAKRRLVLALLVVSGTLLAYLTPYHMTAGALMGIALGYSVAHVEMERRRP